MENQVKLNEERATMVAKLKTLMPEVTDPEYKLLETVYREGALSTKTKRLMSLVAALTKGCTNCILAQTDYALKLGTSREEMLETIAVVIAMNGTTGVAESMRVLKMMEETGQL